ncbi:glycosyltransferase family 4 protein [Pyruvatibacter mobilis]|uniref:glycosyltransferase family 4 protein n=1 Tax=Pyruvatibacter mobilis TaxID=1712261 RepID=UPI003BAA8D8C
MSHASAQPRLIVLVPEEGGGISRLFQQLQRGGGQDDRSRLEIDFFLSHDKRRGALLRFPGRLGRFLTRLVLRRPAACHINLASRGSTLRKAIFAWLCRRASVPYVLHLHGGGYRDFFCNLPAPLRSIVRAFFRRAARVIVLGQVWRDFVVEVIGVDPARVVILPNAVHGPDAVPNRDAPGRVPQILFLGRLGPGKGIPELVEALARDDMRSLSWRAVLAGDGQVAETQAAVAAAGLDDRVEVPGWVGPEAVEALLAASDILALPSHVENLPLSMLEGMGYGLCPVVTPVGAVPDVIRDGENGLLVPVDDAAALASALARLVSDTELRDRLAVQARADFEVSYDIRHYRGKLEAIYLDVLGEAGQRSAR